MFFIFIASNITFLVGGMALPSRTQHSLSFSRVAPLLLLLLLGKVSGY